MSIEKIVELAAIATEKSLTFNELREAQRRAYGSNFLSRFWMRRVYPVLFPKKHKVLIDKCDDLAIQCKREFLDALLERCQTGL